VKLNHLSKNKMEYFYKKANFCLSSHEYAQALTYLKRALYLWPELRDLTWQKILITESKASKSLPKNKNNRRESVDIVVPVFNALDDTKKCLDSILHKTNLSIGDHVLIINDCSDQETSIWLRNFCLSNERIFLIESSSNNGFTVSLNIGCRLSRAEYIVSLNSDTIVTNGWMSRLLACMRSDATIGIVGPLSNAASWQNVPELLGEDKKFAVNRIPEDLSLEDVSQVVAHEFKETTYVEVPCLNGFCLMLRRAVIDRIGYFDEGNFPVGYGEENDYCIRARDANFRLFVASDAFVFHAKSKSFGHSRREALSSKGKAALTLKHGDKYSKLLADVSGDHLAGRRREIERSLNSVSSHEGATAVAPSLTILYLLPVKGGGGGAHSILQEAGYMAEHLGQVNVLVRKAHLSDYFAKYPEEKNLDKLLIGYSDEHDLIRLAKNCDILVATIFSSVELVLKICAESTKTMPAYYIQDYEPLFFDEGSDNYTRAKNSYTALPEVCFFAKTDWLCREVAVRHGTHVWKVPPSLDHSIYRTTDRDLGDRGSLVTLVAMIRPSTPRRGAGRTLRILAALAGELNSSVRIKLFGCTDEDLSGIGIDVPGATNYGQLTRQQVADLLRTADVFVDFSDYQAFGRTGLEAMACGCVSLLPILGGTDEYAVDGKNSLLVDVSDEAACISRLKTIIGSSITLERMRAQAVKTAQRYSIERASRVIFQLFVRRRHIWDAVWLPK
jgi:GT2 family glycosyltransferase/glycosyltransferase involved in cell wall biosynthesis